jgi:hypothetical protein
MTDALAQASRGYQASRDEKPLEVSRGPAREIFFDRILRARGCEADLLVDGKKTGTVSQFAIMTGGGRFTTAGSTISIGSQ